MGRLPFFPLRADQRDAGGLQISHVYTVRFPYISDRLYFSGFFDHNISNIGIGFEIKTVW